MISQLVQIQILHMRLQLLRQIEKLKFILITPGAEVLIITEIPERLPLELILPEEAEREVLEREIPVPLLAVQA